MTAAALAVPAAADLAPTTSDAMLLARLQRRPELLAQMQAEAGAQMRQARGLGFAPVQRIAAQWQAFQQRMVAAAAPRGTNHNSEVEQRARVAMLRIATEAADTFASYMRMSISERTELWQRDRENFAIGLNAAGHVTSSTFSADVCIRQLAVRGVALARGHDDALLAYPASLVTPQVQAVLTAHKAELLAVLGAAVAIA